jgi:hypothetical protein
MIKLILVGVWACFVTFGASYATTYLHTMFAKSATEQKAVDVDSRKTKEINVPRRYVTRLRCRGVRLFRQYDGPEEDAGLA